MDNDKKFPEQDAPEKNNDDAFVKVGENGAPVIPSDAGKETDAEKEGHTTTLDKR